MKGKLNEKYFKTLYSNSQLKLKNLERQRVFDLDNDIVTLKIVTFSMVGFACEEKFCRLETFPILEAR